MTALPLYHYSSLRHARDLFEKGLHMSSPFTFNDPFDSYLSYTEYYSGIRADPTKKSNVNIEDAIYLNAIDDEYIQLGLQSKYRIACLSESLLYSPQWAYYADSHKGICVEYDTEKLISYCKSNGIIMGRVRYSAQPLTDCTNTLDLKALIRSAFNKSEEFAAEKEWRLLKFGDSDFIPIQDAIRRVYVGCRTHFLWNKDKTRTETEKLSTLRKIIDHCQSEGIDVRMMYPKPGTFDLGYFTEDQISWSSLTFHIYAERQMIFPSEKHDDDSL